MTLQNLVLPSFAQMLEALSGQLCKAKSEFEGKGKSCETLLSARLAPDMHPLSAQVQFACIQAEEVRARLFDEVIEEVDAPRSFDQATDLIARTAGRLRESATKGRLADDARGIELSLPNGMTFDFDLFEYVRSWSIPQFYFHIVTAYAIMRKDGVSLGKPDYVPHMFQFLRPEAT